MKTEERYGNVENISEYRCDWKTVGTTGRKISPWFSK